MILPKSKWIKISDRNPPEETNIVFYGIVNVGSEHEGYCTFFGKWINGKWSDLHGDNLTCPEPIYWLEIESTFKPTAIKITE